VYDGPFVTEETWSGPVSATITRTFDTHFRLASRAISGGAAISFGYDDDGLLTQAGDMTVARDSTNGLLTGTTLGNITDAYGYNGFGEVTSYNAQFMQVPLYQVSYARDALGRITQKTETIGGQAHLFAYEYDPAGRLKSVTNDGVFASEYTYDLNGNRLSHTTLTATVTADYDAQDRLLRYGDYNFTYTRNGEMETKVHVPTGDITTFLYDEFSNLRHVEMPNGDQLEYVIDARNRRIGKRLNGVLTTRFLFDSQLRVGAELDSTGGVVSTFVYTGGQSTPSYMLRGGVTYRIQKDHVGSPLQVIDVTTGIAAQTIRYDEFGMVVSDSAPGFQPFSFAGGIRDSDTSLVRIGARDLDPVTGRWTTKDPIRFAGGSSNIYAYVGNEPVNFSDPSGLRFTHLTPNELAVLQILLDNPEIGPAVRELYFAKDIDIRFDELPATDPEIIQDGGGSMVYSPSKTCGGTDKVRISYNQRIAQKTLAKLPRQWLWETRAREIFAHELGHTYYHYTHPDEGPSSSPDSDAMALAFENAVRRYLVRTEH